MTNVALTTLTKVGRMASHGVTLGVTKGVKKGVKLKLIASLHLVLYTQKDIIVNLYNDA